jgi:hypothetical protein
MDNITLPNSIDDSSSLFNIHELWGIAISTIYFILGFPTNLLSIIVCCKSLFHKFFNPKSDTIRRINIDEKKSVRKASTTANPNLNKLNNNNNYSVNNNDKININVNKNNNNYLEDEIENDDAYNPCLTNKNCQIRYSGGNQLKSSYRTRRTLSRKIDLKNNSLKKKSTQSQQNQTQIYTNNTNNTNNNNKNLDRQNINIQQPTQIKNSISHSNPHRKCFELYLIEISFCDLIILGYNFTEWALLILSRFNLIDHIYAEPVLISNFMCKFIISLNRTIILMHNWLVASLAITRCYAIYKPINSMAYFSSKFYYRLNLSVVFFLVLLFSSINIYGVMLLSYTKGGISNENNTISENIRPACRISNEIYEKYKYIDVYMNIILGIIGYSLPCCVTLIMNLILVYNIRHLQVKAKKNTDERNAEKNRNKFFKATSSLLMLSFGYIICYLPYSCMFLLLSLDMIKMNGNVIFVLTSLRYLNHTLNFYIYFSTGKNFRNGVISFLFGCKGK